MREAIVSQDHIFLVLHCLFYHFHRSYLQQLDIRSMRDELESDEYVQ